MEYNRLINSVQKFRLKNPAYLFQNARFHGFVISFFIIPRSKSEMDLITRQVIRELEGDLVTDKLLDEYVNPDSQKYLDMIEGIRKKLNFTSLKFHRLDDLIESIGIGAEKLCTYCWSGKE